MSNKHLIQLFIFIFSSKPGSVFLQSHPPQDTLCTSFQVKWKTQGFRFKFVQKKDLRSKFQTKNQYPQDLGLKFEKTNIEIKINICEIVCMCVSIFRQNKQLLLFQPKFAQKWI